MTQLFDTHCHLTHPPLQQQLPQVLTQARASGVSRLLVPATGPNDWHNILELPQQYQGITIALGIHPWYSSSYQPAAMEVLTHHLKQDPTLLVGEIGLDHHHAKEASQRQLQQACFESQLTLAQQQQRPVIVHHVHATTACINSIQRCHFTYGGFAHAFSGSLEEAHAWHKQGFMLGMGSLLLNPRAQKIRRIAATLPLDYMVLETDAPYMLPHQTNNPANTRRIAEIIAELRGCDWQEVAHRCYLNANQYINMHA